MTSRARALIRLHALVLIDLFVELNPGVGDLDATIDEREGVFGGDLLLDLAHVALRVSLTCSIDVPLDIGLDLEVELHAEIRTAIPLDALGGIKIGAIDERVVLHLARLHEAVMNGLSLGHLAAFPEPRAAIASQRRNLDAVNLAPRPIAAKIDVAGLDQALRFEVTQVLIELALLAVIDRVSEIAGADDTEAP